MICCSSEPSNVLRCAAWASASAAFAAATSAGSGPFRIRSNRAWAASSAAWADRRSSSRAPAFNSARAAWARCKLRFSLGHRRGLAGRVQPHDRLAGGDLFALVYQHLRHDAACRQAEPGYAGRRYLGFRDDPAVRLHGRRSRGGLPSARCTCLHPAADHQVAHADHHSRDHDPDNELFHGIPLVFCSTSTGHCEGVSPKQSLAYFRDCFGVPIPLRGDGVRPLAMILHDSSLGFRHWLLATRHSSLIRQHIPHAHP